MSSVVPQITKIKKVPGTPFITNIEKEVYGNKMKQMPSQTQSTSQDTRPQQDKKRSAPRDRNAGIPVLNSQSIKNPSTMEPTFKLEMFAPKQPQVKPIGIYEPYIPLVDIGNNKKFSLPAFQYLAAPTSAFSYGPNVKMPVQQVNYITLSGPTGDHIEMNKVYENVMPGKENKLTSTTLGERLQTYDFIRQIFVKISDGEDISLDSSGQNSLMSYIKFMELNPNYYSPIYSNPYKGLPYGLLIYRSCFPIRLYEPGQSIVCAKNSVGLNIRLYSLTYAEFYSYKFRQIVYKEYDVWRELAYYEYMRENVIKKRQSPNFPLLYAFFLSPNRKIDFFALKKNCLTQKDFLSQEHYRFKGIHEFFSNVKPIEKLLRPIQLQLPDTVRKVITKLPDEMDPELQKYSGTTMILITESPHHNLYQWASRIYENEGIARRMISHGFNDENVWLGVLFQIVSALSVMQIHGIYMRDMTIEDNVYIKDLQSRGKAMGYWKYIINGISYYIPNYGYVVYIDSNFKDIIPPGVTIERCKREYKIYTSNIIGIQYPMDFIRQKVHENYKRIVSTNAFTKEHTQNNVTKPPEKIMKLLEIMMTDTEIDLAKIISKYFRFFMHNRIGTLLRKDTEIPNIREITGQFKIGEMAIEVLEENLYKWCLVLSIKPDGIIEIITRENPQSHDFVTKDTRIESLKQYSSSEKIDQNTSPLVNLSEEELLETYIISD